MIAQKRTNIPLQNKPKSKVVLQGVSSVHHACK